MRIFSTALIMPERSFSPDPELTGKSRRDEKLCRHDSKPSPLKQLYGSSSRNCGAIYL
jgi:hypothetical protein